MEAVRDIYLHRLSLYQFKCYAEASLVFTQPVICLLGHNGAGKTNLLDAIHYLSFSKSYFNSIDSQNVLSGMDECSISGEFTRGDVPEHVVCAWRKGQRKVMKRNHKEYDKLADHIGLLPAVIITPFDTELILDGSEVRRRFMDSTLSQVSHVYLDHLIRYNHALQQRNTLLRQLGRNAVSQAVLFEPWDHQLDYHGTAVHTERKDFMAQFVPLFMSIYDQISGGRETPALLYSSDLYEKGMAELLRTSFSRDCALERTTTGIHKDDLEFRLNDLVLRKFGSQGQQKSFLIALKLTQLLFLRNKSGMSPLLMLDDLYDKLDEGRVHNLLSWIHANHSGQLFITDTHLHRIPELLGRLNIPFEVFEVTDAAVKMRKSANP